MLTLLEKKSCMKLNLCVLLREAKLVKRMCVSGFCNNLIRL